MRGKSSSPLNRSERLQRAYELFAKGFSTADVARRLKVHPDTAATYRVKYEERIQNQVAEHPDLLSDVLGNTLRILEEVDLIKKDAWKQLSKKRIHYCDECGDPCGCEEGPPHSAVTGYHNTLLKAQDQRMKVLGLLGVKQEYFIRVQEIEALQRKLLDFMASNLCMADRERLEGFLGSELPALMEKSSIPIIDLDALSEEYVNT